MVLTRDELFLNCGYCSLLLLVFCLWIVLHAVKVRALLNFAYIEFSRSKFFFYLVSFCLIAVMIKKARFKIILKVILKLQI